MVEMLEGTALDSSQREYVTVLRRATETLIAVVEGVPQTNDAGVGTGPGDFSGFRILVVDDSEDNRYLIVRYLKNTGAVIDEAVNGAEALDRIKANQYNAVLMDVEMPVMDGFTASRAIREWEHGTGRHTRILALTARDPAEAMEKSRAAGCDELITKPVRKATLIQALSQGSEVADLVPGYLARRRADLPKLREALAAQDFATLRSMGHKLSGTGAGYGLPALSTIGAALERAARASDIAPMKGLIDALESAVSE